ncbi:Diphosphomevalonate decarboxylase [Gigaspora margarita]|uniref:Diphosphomevalonate decarboxylase n=1 Tax=Gigaspora margarita TaxID=4874 RepID=A0A8H3X6W1_GIGMA|nr:Diphosphomevalonate decarboxylase [Gigaspora margarita]
MGTVYEKTATSPVNIAVIKYWGKRDTNLILPTNSSLSVTLSQDHLQSKTTIRASSDFEKTRLWLNGVEDTDIEKNKRLQNCLSETRRLRKEYEERLRKDKNVDNVIPLSEYNLHICSENNFPTAAGLASSASGFACLAYTLSQLYELPISTTELSKIARQGSGSACRSLFGGFVAWEMGSQDDGSDSQAVQIASQDHWPELEALICVVSDAKKDTSSTEGMQNTVNTSTLLQHRIEHVVPLRMKSMIKAIHERDFQKFAEITMQDSNQFHAMCLDTYPPIFYLNDVSRAIIRVITEYNSSNPERKLKAAYTFDAGPNAVIYTTSENAPEIINLIAKYFPGNENTRDYFSDPFQLFVGKAIGEQPLPLGFNDQIISVFPKGNVKQILHTKVGEGPKVVAGEFDGLLNKQGWPKKLN